MPTRDDLDRRLQHAAGPAPDPEPALAKIAGQLDTTSRRTHRVLAAAAILVVLAGGWVAVQSRPGGDGSVRSGQSSTIPGSTSPPTTTSTTALTYYDPPPGFVAVVDGDGNLAGYIPSPDGELNPLPTLDFGTGPPVSGQQVVDEHGQPTGYLIAGIGFITNEQARDPAEVDRLVAEYEARKSAFLEESVGHDGQGG